MKKCARCGADKPFSDFHKNMRSKDGLARWCKVCIKTYGISYRTVRDRPEGVPKKSRKVSEIKDRKRCYVCKTEKPIDGFSRNKYSSDGRSSVCKECSSTHSRAYYSANRIAIRAQQKGSSSRWAKANPDANRAKAKRWREANVERCREIRRLWARAHPEHSRANLNKRRALKRGAGGTYAVKDVERLFEIQGCKCLACEADLKLGYHVDHIIPLSRGGSNGVENIQLLCPHCNISKNNKTMDEFLQSRVA